jgi:hypothetical protein
LVFSYFAIGYFLRTRLLLEGGDDSRGLEGE